MLIYEGGENIKKYPYVKQRGLKECGPACVQMILKYYHGYLSIDKLSEMMYTNQNGTTAYHINETLKNLGFNSNGFKNSRLSDLKLPCIAHVIIKHSYKHYIVIYKINQKKKTILIADPATSLKHITFDEFKQIWTGITIQMYPVKPVTYEKQPKILSFLWYYIKKNWKLVLLVNIISLFATLAALLSSLFLPIIINCDKKVVSDIFLTFFFIFLIKDLLNFIKNKLLLNLNLKLDKQLTLDIFWKIINLPYRYYRRKTTGEVMSYFNDLYIIKNAITHLSKTILIDLPMLILVIVIIYHINYQIIIFTFLLVGIYYYIHKALSTFKLDEITRQKYQVNSYVAESISAFETIQNLNVKSKINKNFVSTYQNLNKKIKNIYFRHENLFLIQNILENLILLFIIWLLVQNDISVLITVYLLLSIFLNILKNFFDFSYNLDELKYAISNIIQLDYSKAELIKLNSNNIIIKNLSFSYDKLTMTLKNINCIIKDQSKVLVTGSSGSGKSTLFKIIKGYYSDYEGSIIIGDKNIKNKNFEDIIYVSSKEFLFTGSLIENLKLKSFNQNSINICEIKSLCQNNFYQLIEENGFNLSSGQKQRIALARALCDFQILILDEALSQVSVDMERRILKKLFKTYSNKTIIYISHRLDNLDLFDHFIKIKDGQIILNTRRNN